MIRTLCTPAGRWRWAIHKSVQRFPWIELHCPRIEVTKPRVPPPDLINVLCDRQEPEDFSTKHGADKYMLIVPPELAMILHASHHKVGAVLNRWKAFGKFPRTGHVDRSWRRKIERFVRPLEVIDLSEFQK